MKKITELDYTEQRQFAELLAPWLGRYTEEVTAKVFPKLEEIYNNEHVMHMLAELRYREEKEKLETADSFWLIVKDATNGKEFDDHCMHNHCITHAGSYRDVLYDMYLR